MIPPWIAWACDEHIWPNIPPGDKRELNRETLEDLGFSKEEIEGILEWIIYEQK